MVIRILMFLLISSCLFGQSLLNQRNFLTEDVWDFNHYQSRVIKDRSGFIGSQLDSTNFVRLLLPDTIYISASDSTEANIYNENIVCVPNSGDYFFNYNCAMGEQYEYGWRYTPEKSEYGQFGMSVSVYNSSGDLITTASTIVKVDSNNFITSNDTLLLIGDSITDYNIYPAEIYTLSGDNIQMIGTQDSGTDSPNEGYSGQSWEWIESGSASPFLNGDGDFSMSFYLSDNGFNNPDFVIITFGTNDVRENIEESAAGYADIFAAMDTVVNNILADLPSAKIGIGYVIPPAYEQSAAGYTKASALTFRHTRDRWQVKRRIHLYNELLKRRYGANGTHNNSRVFLIPTYIGIDTKHNFPTTTQNYNARNTDTRTVQNDLVHPANSGYWQMADYYYGWLTNQNATVRPALQLWLEALDGVSIDGSNRVDLWEDKSDNGDDLIQSSAALRPFYYPDSVDFTELNNYYLESTTKPAQTGTIEAYVYVRKSASNILIGAQATDRCYLGFNTKVAGGLGNDAWNTVLGNTTVYAGEKHGIALTWDGIEWKLYLDGVEDASGSQSGGVPNETFNLGNINSSGAYPFKGCLYGLKIWRTVRTQSEIAAQYSTWSTNYGL